MAVVAGLALIAIATLTAVEVSGTSTCPAPSDVEARLEQQLGASLSGANLRATLNATGQGLAVELRTVDGAVIAERLLAGPAQCEELAAAASVMLASWARDFERQSTPELPARDLPAVPLEERETLPLRDEVLPAYRYDLSAGLSASLARGGVAAGGLLTLGMTARTSRVGGQLSIAALGARTASQGTTWERFAVALGPHYRFTPASLSIDVHAEGLAALLSVVSASAEDSALTFDPGIGAGVRVLGNSGLWAGLRGALWFTPRPLPDGGTLPNAELLLSAGLQWSSP